MSSEFKQTVHDFAINFGKVLENAAKETTQRSQEFKEQEKLLKMQENQANLVFQEDGLKEAMVRVWAGYLKEDKGITVGYGKNGDGKPVVKKIADKICVLLPSNVDGIGMETDLNNLCEHDWDGFKDYMMRKEAELLSSISDMQQKVLVLEDREWRANSEIQDLEQEYAVATDFSTRSQKRRMYNDRMNEIDRIGLEKGVLEGKICQTQRKHDDLLAVLYFANKRKIRHVEYNRNTKNKMLVLTVE